MKIHVVKLLAVTVSVLFLSITALELNAHARAGGSRSSGSSGSRSNSRSVSPAYQPSPSRQQAAPAPIQQPQGGGFLRSMAGGLAGGMLGSMLFSSFAGAGGGGGMGGGGGIGLFGIILLAGVGYLIYRYIKNNRGDNSIFPSMGGYQRETIIPISTSQQSNEQISDGAGIGLANIRQVDPSFDENRFNDLVMDMFFKIQGAWMNRDLSPVSGILTDEMKRIFQTDLEKLLQNKQVNRLENIAVRNVSITEVWQESGQDYITTMIYANLLDYTTNELTGEVVSGSKTDPVKFEEFWTFNRPFGNNPWRLTSISQA